jgi:outer membrane receptor protein involved in Fe transport
VCADNHNDLPSAFAKGMPGLQPGGFEMRSFGKHAGTAVSLLPLIAMGSVAARAADAPPAAPTEPGALETIVVTAQKTTTSLQKTPIAITALSGDQLGKNDIRSAIDLDKHVPGMTVSDGGAFPLNITIRGVGYDGLQNLSAQPGVAFVENGVYIASPVAVVASYLDVGQLEVLRGPQGTVNGQNADGGAINLTTNLTGSNDIATRYAENFGVGGVFDVYVPPRQVIGRVGVKF